MPKASWSMGGAEGIRDEGALGSALVKPINQYAYAGTSDMSVLAAAARQASAGIIPSSMVTYLPRSSLWAFFLAVNGLRLVAPRADTAWVMLALAAGQLSEAELAEWVHSHLDPR